MLSKSDLAANYWMLERLSRLRIIPFEFDIDDGSLKRVKKVHPYYWLRMLLVLCGIIYKWIRLVQTLLYPEEFFELRGFCYHVLFLFGTVYVGLLGVQVLFQARDTVSFLITRLHAGKRESSQVHKKRLWYRAFQLLKTHSITEVTIVLFPIAVYALLPGILGFYLLDPKATHLMSSIVPGSLPAPALVLVSAACMEFELWMVFEVITVVYFSIFTLLSFVVPHLCEDLLGNIQSKLRLGRAWNFPELYGIIRTLREIRLEIELCNETFAGVMYLTKVTGIYGAVTFLFVGVRFLDSSPILGALLVLVGLEIVVGYSLVFGRFFLVSQNLADVKRLALKASIVNGTSDVRAWRGQEIQAIRTVGIRAGHFYTLDRTSTPAFVDFVFKQLQGLLVSFT